MMLQILISLQVVPVPDVARVNSLCRWGDRLVVAGQGGVVVMTVYPPMQVKDALSTPEPVQLAAPDPSTGDIYYISNGTLFKWWPGSPQPFRLTRVSGSSLGVGIKNIYVDNQALSKGGVKTTGDPARDNVVWAGARANLSQDDNSILFLQPFRLITREAGEIRMTVFYKNMRELWVGTWGRGTYLYGIESWQLRDSACPSPALEKTCCLAGNDSTLWAGGPDGASVMENGFWNTYTKQGSLFWCSGVNDIYLIKDRVYLAADCGLLVGQGRDFLLAKTQGARATAVMASDTGVWVGTTRGVFWTTPGSRSLSRIPGTENHRVNQLILWRDKALALTDIGVMIISGDSLGLMSGKNGPAGEAYCGFVRGDTLWVISAGGMSGYDGTHWEQASLPFSPVSQRAHGVDANQNYTGIATDNGVYFMFTRDGRWERITSFHGLPSDMCWDVWLNGDSAVVATDRGLVKVYLDR